MDLGLPEKEQERVAHHRGRGRGDAGEANSSGAFRRTNAQQPREVSLQANGVGRPSPGSGPCARDERPTAERTRTAEATKLRAEDLANRGGISNNWDEPAGNLETGLRRTSRRAAPKITKERSVASRLA